MIFFLPFHYLLKLSFKGKIEEEKRQELHRIPLERTQPRRNEWVRNPTVEFNCVLIQIKSNADLLKVIPEKARQNE